MPQRILFSICAYAQYSAQLNAPPVPPLPVTVLPTNVQLLTSTHEPMLFDIPPPSEYAILSVIRQLSTSCAVSDQPSKNIAPPVPSTEPLAVLSLSTEFLIFTVPLINASPPPALSAELPIILQSLISFTSQL